MLVTKFVDGMVLTSSEKPVEMEIVEKVDVENWVEVGLGVHAIAN